MSTSVFKLNVPLWDKQDVNSPNLSNNLPSLSAVNRYK